MRFKSRPPMSESPSESGSAPENRIEAQDEQTQSPDPLRGAFDAIFSVLRGEIDSLRRTIDDLTAKVEQRIDAANDHANEIRSGLEQSLKAKEEKLAGELDNLTRTLSSVRGDLERQMATSGQVTALLNNMAGIFAAGTSLSTGPQTTHQGSSSHARLPETPTK